MDNKKLSNKHEQYIAKVLGGKTQIASGAIPLVGMKGDVVTKDFLIECKATAKSYFNLKRKVVEKIEKEALKCGRVPLLAIRTSIGDFILYRNADFFNDDAEIDMVCNESLKLTDSLLSNIQTSDPELFRVMAPCIQIRERKWCLVDIDIFKKCLM